MGKKHSPFLRTVKTRPKSKAEKMEERRSKYMDHDEEEEELLTNTLQKKLEKVQQEKVFIEKESKI